MPEGDTVRRARDRLHEALAREAITGSDFRVPNLATASVVGSTITEVVSRGKHLLFRLDDSRTLHTHFRMDGSWHLYRPGTPWRGGPVHQIRVVLRTDGWDAVGYRLPVVDLGPSAHEQALVGHLGPDLLGPDWDPERARRALATQPDRAIGEALLDQRNLAGLGTIYVSETCFAAGARPARPCRDVNLSLVVSTAHRLLNGGLRWPMACTTGDPRRPLQVYGRAGRPCRRCGSRISRVDVGAAPRSRTLDFCPTCQA